ncbi:XRE family transcriptional regulator [Escherichia coli]|nr:XRE family transcriptional regulator [Escherichia coli]EIT0966525.1 XRE family transcriptional regulator [Escherichia coli]HAW2879002.1 XRE family transcriptional regulator [Escherichia coli]HCP3668217.1 XRE family transcriptional regulator [Escherichia coli]HCQ8908693.1 XRE family transcriptional regulator [Escherichia coli]
MILINKYLPPMQENLVKRKSALNYYVNQMAGIAGVDSDSQCRKYTSNEISRVMSKHLLFYIAAQLIMFDEQLNNVTNKMRNIGAEIQ